MTNKTVNLATLLENDLEQAKLVIAAQDVLDRLQKIAEHLAELGAEEIMPLSDNMKAAFGPDVAKDFEQTADEAIQQALSSVRNARDVIDEAILRVQGMMPQTDMDSYDGENPTPEGNDMADADFSQEVDSEANQQMQQGEDADTILGDDDDEDGFSGSESSADDQPMGRAKRESIEDRKALVEKLFHENGTKIIMTESIGSLVNWLLEDAAARLSPEKYDAFKNKVDIKLENDPIGLAGMIGFKKSSVAGQAQNATPIVSPSAEKWGIKIESKWTPIERKARGVAKVIEANILAYGNGKASNVIRQFTTTDLNENAEKNLIETFKNIYGSSPSEFSVKLKKHMSEDIVPTNSPIASDDTASDMASSTTDNTDIKPDTSLTTVQKSNAAMGVAKLAAQVGDNAANAQKPLSASLSTLSGPEKQAVNTVVDNIDDQTGEQTDQVGELISKASDVIGEEGPSEKLHPDLETAYMKIIDRSSPEDLQKIINRSQESDKVPTELVSMAKSKLEKIGQ